MKSLNPWNEIENIIFDLDGVLIESEHLHATAKVLTLEKYGLKFKEEELQKRFTGISDQDFWVIIKNEHPEISDSIEDLTILKKEVYLTLTSGLQKIPGSVEFIRWAKTEHKRLGVVTSSDNFYQGIAFKFLGINDAIDLLVNADDVTRYKPDPEPYLKMKNKLGENSLKSFVIEDSPSGIKSAKGAGFFVIGMTSSFDSKTLLSAGADMTVGSYEELKKHLK